MNEPTTYSLRVVSKRNKYYSHIIIVICFEERLQLFTRGKRAWYSKRTELLINHALPRLLSCKVMTPKGLDKGLVKGCVCFFFFKNLMAPYTNNKQYRMKIELGIFNLNAHVLGSYTRTKQKNFLLQGV